MAAPAPLDSSKLTIQLPHTPRAVPGTNAPARLSSSYQSDHMLTIGPYTNISLPPTASIFHYATTCFEGLKVYRGDYGRARLFRPDLNAAQSQPGSFLYVRPVIMATESTIGFRPSQEALLYIIAVTFPQIEEPSYETKKLTGFKLLASSTTHSPAWPGSSGDAKVGLNYASTLPLQKEAQNNDLDQVLWLYGGAGFEKNPLVTEAGGGNFFVVWRTTGGKLQLITATLGRGLILPGITRQSVLKFSPDLFRDELDVVEKDFGIEDIMTASKEGRLMEVFAVGTSYFVTPVTQIVYQGVEVQFPTSQGAAGKYTFAIREYLRAL
ncbi:aminotransferase [Xylariales sp. PMI_506]|nr:aminotransferase [Xylariales sp. PMI_506]